MSKGILTVVSGFSGAGKGTVMGELLKKYENYALSVSATTRAPRENEIEGVSYFFKTTEEFEKMISEEKFLEYAKYVSHYYGTPRSYVEEQLAAGKDVILEIEIQGAMNIKKMIPEAITVFVTAPNMQILRERLTSRGTETAEVIDARLKRAVQEAEGIEQYDYLLVNDKLEECVESLHAIIQSEHKKADRNAEFIRQIQADVQQFL